VDVGVVFKMYKGELKLETTNLSLVNILIKQGWKIQYSELGELI